MKRSRRSNRSGLSAGFRKLFGRPADRPGRKAAALADAAGGAGGFEALEPRQMLFTLTIDPGSVDPQTGIGTVQAFFGYTIPYLQSPITPGNQPNQASLEDFNRDLPTTPATPPPANVPTGFIWNTSNLYVEHTLTDLTLVLEPTVPPDPPPQGMNELRVTMQSGQRLELSVVQQRPQNSPFVRIGATDKIGVPSVSVDIGSGLQTNSTTVFLLDDDGQVITSFTGAALDALGTPLANGDVRYTFGGNGPIYTLRFVASVGAPADVFTVDNYATTRPAGNLVPIVESRIFGVTMVFSGPANSTVNVKDLYGEEMRLTIALGVPPNAVVPITLVDPDDDGVPNWNDGIGSITLSGVNDRSALTMFGGTIATGVNPTADFVEGGFSYTMTTTVVGLFDTFEGAGMGYNITVPPGGGTPTITGLPPGPGSLIIGSPFVRNHSSAAAYNPAGTAALFPVTTGFTRTDQGVFVAPGFSMGSVYVHGILYGVSRFPRTLDRFNVGSFMGSASVGGDLGWLMVGGDAAMWVDDDGTPAVATGGQLTVGRTIGSIDVGGRSLLTTTVFGNLNTPSISPSRDIFRYFEKEYAQFAFNPPNGTVRGSLGNILANNASIGRNDVLGATGIFPRTDQSQVFGTGYYRNDTILSAEWIGSSATAVEIHGEAGQGDPVNTVEDPGDVYAFAVDGTQDIFVDFSSGLAGALIGNIRLMDANGRTLAAPQFAPDFRRAVQIRYRPTGPGVYYLVVNANGVAGAPDTLGFTPYIVTVSGMAPTTLGMYRAAASIGSTAAALSNTISVISGSIGSIRAGTAFINGTGIETDPSVIYNNIAGQNLDAAMSLRGCTVSTPANLYNITAGSDVGDTLGTPTIFLNVGGNFGTMFTGLSAVAGERGPKEGDLQSISMTIGGSIAMLDIRGGVGIDEDSVEGLGAPAISLPGSVVIRTGTSPTQRGDIGMIRVGSRVGGDTLVVRTSNGSVIGAFLVDQDNPDDLGNTFRGIMSPGGRGNGVDVRLGFNSDLRFFDTPQIDIQNVDNQTFALIPGTPIEFTDDGGGRVRIQIIGGAGTAFGLLRVTPIGGSLGVAIGRIEVNLSGGARLQITGLGPVGSTDVISIGQVIIRGSDAASSIGIDGNTQVDIWRIQQLGGDAFNEIVNMTPNGDIVAIDMVSLNRLEIGTGDLGRTQLPAWGPQLLGPFLGIGGQAAQGEVGGTIALPAALMGPAWNGATYRPVNNANGNSPPSGWLDDIGSPIDPYLDGLIVRTGDITSVRVGGAIGDVIANDGNIVTVTANADLMTPAGRFEGIVGNIYATRISLVDVGDGLARGEVQSPLATTGIIARDDILRIVASRPGSFLSGNIIAGNLVIGNNTPGTFPTDGIDTIDIQGSGGIVDAFIGSDRLHAFWTAFFPADERVYAGNIGNITGRAGAGAPGGPPATPPNIFRSEISALDINSVVLNGGFFDASLLAAGRNLLRLETAGYRNSTLLGSVLEFHENRITVGNNLLLMTTTGRAGDISDIHVDVLGNINELSGRNISRSTIDSDQGILLLQTVGSMRGTTLTAGVLTRGEIGASIRSSQINIAGPLVLLNVADSITNTDITVSGPDGRIDMIKARQEFSGSVSSAGPIDTIEVTEGDLRISLVTVVNQRGVAGDVKLLKAARDLDVHGDVGGTVEQFVAGRHFGRQFVRQVLVIHGTVELVDLAGGQLYTDLRISQTLQSAIIGTAVNLPGGSNLGTGSIYASGRIEAVTINGDFGAEITSASGGIGVITLNDGSLLPTSSINAFDGTLNNIIINNGHLLGSVHADHNLLSIRLNGSADGVFGDLGVNPDLSSGTSAGPNRNQLPPGVIANGDINGPRITAGFNLGRIILTNGSIFEAYISAGRAIGTIDVTGDIRKDPVTTGQATIIAAGSSIFTIHATGVIAATDILAGVRSFGADDLPGGVGANADTVRSGRIETVRGDAGGGSVRVTAGMVAGADGQYNTADDLVTPGISFVRAVTFGGAPVTNVTVFADSRTLTTSAGVVTGGFNLANADPDLSTGAATGTQLAADAPFAFTWQGVSGTIVYSGPGAIFWDAATGTLQLINSKLTTDVTVNAAGTLNNFKIVTNDDASMGTITVNAGLGGNSVIDVDAYVLGINLASVGGNTRIKTGMNTRSIVTGNFTGGSIDAAFWARDIIINGSYGDPDVTGETSIHALAGSSIAIAGNNSGLINIERDLAALSVGGSMVLAQFRSGASVGSIIVGSLDRSRVSVADTLGTLTVAGDFNDTAVQVGGDLGDDAAPGGTGFNADRPTQGDLGTAAIGGNFVRSSIVAGFLRGPDGFFGTPDDIIAPGRSTIGDVNIAGFAAGSTFNTEQFRITSTGTLGDVTVLQQSPTATPNLKIGATPTDVLPIRVLDLRAQAAGGVWQAFLFFNQPMNASTIGPALTIAEVRDGGATLIPLVEGVDYTLGDYDPIRNSQQILFSTDLTGRDLIDPGIPDPALPGPGVYRFVLDADVIRGAVADARMDGDGNGIATPGEDYSEETVVGDAGDKITPQIFDFNGYRVDAFGPADLDVILDNNRTPDTLPDPNTVYRLRGAIGDHPDNDVANFLLSSDTDLYKITLQAGQILRLGSMGGSALFAGRFLYNASGDLQFGATPDSVQLTVDPFTVLDLTQDSAWLIKTTGVYFLAVTNQFPPDVPGAGLDPQIPVFPGTTGDYEFTLEVFDDGDTGFAAPTNSGNGTPVINAPAVIVFAGPNGVFQDPADPTYDDLGVVTVGAYKFFLDAGADGVRGTADDTVSGTNDAGITSSRAGTQLTTVINSALGTPGHTGVPGAVSADADVYHLNNGQTIAPGKVITVKIKLAELGADLGSFSEETFTSFLGDVQFGIFDTTGASSVDDATLLLSPSDFRPIPGQPGEIARIGQSAYGFDANGDFFVTFVTPNRIGGAPGEAASFAIYLQGDFNTDYTIEITQNEANSGSVPQLVQNVFLETRGGTIDWLEAGGLTTRLDKFASSVLGFTGAVGGLPVDQYIVSRLVSTLQSVFAATGMNINISSSPTAFEFQSFSTVFLTSSPDPINSFSADLYGYSEHSDAYNLDRNDQGVVFLPSFADLGYTPSQADVDKFVLTLTAAVGRRVGELMGLRLTDFDFAVSPDPMDIMAANSPYTLPTGLSAYRYVDAKRALSTGFDEIVDTNFFLGQQNAFALLDKFLTP